MVGIHDGRGGVDEECAFPRPPAAENETKTERIKTENRSGGGGDEVSVGNSTSAAEATALSQPSSDGA